MSPAQYEVRWGRHGFGVFQRRRFYLIQCGDCGRPNHSDNVRFGECRYCHSQPAERLRPLAKPSERERPLLL